MLFITNKYTSWYFSIIETARDRGFKNRRDAKSVLGYCEVHHIIPRSLGGDNSQANTVILSGREHLVCHILLRKMTKGQDREKMTRAAILMSTNKEGRRVNSRIYHSIRQEYATFRSKEQQGANNHFFNKKHSEKSLTQMKTTLKTIYTEERCAKIKHARTMWRHNRAHKHAWAIADEIYTTWQSINQPTAFRSIGKAHGLTSNEVDRIVHWFNVGWVPSLDPDWIQWSTEYQIQTTGV